MTQPVPTAIAPAAPSPQQIAIPAATYPMLNRLVAMGPFPKTVDQPVMWLTVDQTGRLIDQKVALPAAEQPIVWEIGKAHPMMSDLLIVRMHMELGVCVEVYSSNPKDGRTGVRHVIPWHLVRMVEEVMDPATFVEEISLAEKGDDEPDPAAPVASTNGVS